MLQMDYPIPQLQSKYACSTMSSGTLSGSCGSRKNRIRTIRLVKQRSGHLQSHSNSRQGHYLGFSIRGGHEHGTGFFVSHVESGSEAHGQGLKIGDQIIRINGFTVEDAVHKEVLQLIASHVHLVLKVRSVGMIPVKDKTSDSLSWQIISDANSSRSSPQFGEKNRDVHISILVAPRSKLGCGICKGPEWKPGIFVQFTKEGGIARDAGLRPGDQILVCNDVDFSDIPFGEAVNLMKSSRQLDLVVRKAAASELFPGESSGYNSSASSVTEDQSPSWSDSKRLSIVKEENSGLEERITKRIMNSPNWNLREWDEEPAESTYYKPTIINLSENGMTIRNNGSDCQSGENKKNKPDDIYEPFQIPKPPETKTVVEVHRTDEDESPNPPVHNKLVKSPSSSSFSSMASKTSVASATSSSLSSALTLEIQRRAEKKAAGKKEEPTIDEQIEMKKVLKGVNMDQQFRHNKLMNEFKQAHQKMFKSSSVEEDTPTQGNVIGTETMDRLAHKEYSKKLLNESLQKVTNSNKSTSAPPVPPPPPPSVTNPTVPIPPPSHTSTLKPKPKAPPVPAKKSTLSFHQPPPCPTPDYDTLSISSSNSFTKPTPSLSGISEAVEMDSLDSFRLNNPGSNVNNSKPPNNYFQKNKLCAKNSNTSIDSSGSSDFGRGVNVTIGGYVPKTTPGKLDFLRNTEKRVIGKRESISTCLASELTQTLNRSNLRKRTESMDDLLGIDHIKTESNGSVRISLNSNLSRELTKSTSDLTEDFGACRPRNRIMINVNHFNEGSRGAVKSSYG